MMLSFSIVTSNDKRFHGIISEGDKKGMTTPKGLDCFSFPCLTFLNFRCSTLVFKYFLYFLQFVLTANLLSFKIFFFIVFNSRTIEFSYQTLVE